VIAVPIAAFVPGAFVDPSTLHQTNTLAVLLVVFAAASI
jgi:hypothetical protein